MKVEVRLQRQKSILQRGQATSQAFVGGRASPQNRPGECSSSHFTLDQLEKSGLGEVP